MYKRQASTDAADATAHSAATAAATTDAAATTSAATAASTDAADATAPSAATAAATTDAAATTSAASTITAAAAPENEMVRFGALCLELKDSVNMTNIDVILSVVDVESMSRHAPLMAEAQVPRLATLNFLTDAAAKIQAAVEQHQKAADKKKGRAKETVKQVQSFKAYMRKFVQPAAPLDSVLTALSPIRRNTGRQPSNTNC